MPGQLNTKPQAGGKRWPDDLSRRYRKLAIPAVVAAVLADRKKPERQPVRRDRAEPEEG